MGGYLTLTECRPTAYKHLVPLYGTDYSVTYKDNTIESTFDVDPVWVEFRDDPAADIIERQASYRRVKPTMSNMQLSLQKMDVPKKEPSGSTYERAFVLTCDYLSFMKSEQSVDYKKFAFIPDTSPGLPWIKIRVKGQRIFKDKKSVINTKYTKLMEYVEGYDKFPLVDTCNHKDEMLSQEDLDRHKIRTTFGSSIQKLFLETSLFGGQNKKILEHTENWIQYGVVKQYGGFNRMIKKLEKHPFRWESDCSGWDRVTCLEVVYRIRDRLLKCDRQLFRHVSAFNINPEFISPIDGNIYRRATGVSSGSLNTTTDNSIKHVFIMIYLFSRRLEEIGIVPNLQDIVDNVELLIYSDDKTGSCNLDFFQFTPSSFLEYECDIYSEFGLIIKPSSQVWTVSPIGSRISIKHSFLGSNCGFTKYGYAPLPRMGMICSSICHEPLRSLSPQESFIRIFCLTMLAQHTPSAQAFKTYFEWYREKFKFGISDLGHFAQKFSGDLIDSYVLYLDFGLEKKIIFQGGRTVFKMNPITINEITPLTPGGPAVAKGARTLKELTASGAFSPADVDFVIAATDPFHDKPLNFLTGIPDGQQGKCVVHDVVQVVEISKPSSLPPGNWNLMISTQPILNEVSMQPFHGYGNTLVRTTIVNGSTMGSVNFSFSSLNNDFSDNYTNSPLPSCNPDIQFLEGPLQVVGMAYEVENTTASMYRQGAYFGAEMNQNPFRTSTFRVVHPEGALWATEKTNSLSLFEVRRPPKNVKELSLLPGNVAWKAEEGCFSVVREMYNQFSHVSSVPTYPFLCETPLPVGSTIGRMIEGWLPAPSNVGWPDESITSIEYCWNNVPNPSNMSISMFMGLSEQTTLTVRVRWLIQRFPTEEDKAIINLAKSGPPRNDKAFELISRTFSSLPPAVPFRMNASGGWWKNVLSALGAAGPLVSMIPHPIAKVVGTAMTGAPALLGSNEKPKQKLLKGSTPQQVPAKKKKKKKAQRPNSL